MVVKNPEALQQLAERFGLKLDDILSPPFYVACQDGTFKKARYLLPENLPPQARHFINLELDSPKSDS